MSLATLIRRMADAGAPPEAIALAVEAIEELQAPIEARRARDRERKRNVRGMSVEFPGKDADIPADVPPSPSLPPTPPNTPPLPPISEAKASGGGPPLETQFIDARDWLWRQGVVDLVAIGVKESLCRGLIGKWLKTAKDDTEVVKAAIIRAGVLRIADAVPWITQAIQAGASDARSDHPRNGYGRGREPTGVAAVGAALAARQARRRESMGAGPGEEWGGRPDDPRVIEADWFDAASH